MELRKCGDFDAGYNRIRIMICRSALLRGSKKVRLCKECNDEAIQCPESEHNNILKPLNPDYVVSPQAGIYL